MSSAHPSRYSIPKDPNRKAHRYKSFLIVDYCTILFSVRQYYHVESEPPILCLSFLLLSLMLVLSWGKCISNACTNVKVASWWHPKHMETKTNTNKQTNKQTNFRSCTGPNLVRIHDESHQDVQEHHDLNHMQDCHTNMRVMHRCRTRKPSMLKALHRIRRMVGGGGQWIRTYEVDHDPATPSDNRDFRHAVSGYDEGSRR